MSYSPFTEYKIKHAIDVIQATYGDTVSVDQKKKDLLKFGRNTNVGTDATGYTIWATGADQAHETYQPANTNLINTFSSANVSDDADIAIEGHTEAGGNKTFVTQYASVSGQSKVSITTGLNRVTRAYVIGATSLAGAMYFYQDTSIASGKPIDTTKIHLTMRQNHNQSEKASTSLSSQDYWIITGVYADVLTKQSSFADVSLQIRRNGSVFREVVTWSASDSHLGLLTFDPFVIVPPNSDVRLVAVGSATIDVSGGMQGYLAVVQ